MYILCSRRSCSLSLRHLVGNSIDQWKRFYPQDGTTRTSDFLLPPRGSDKDNDPANICLAHFPTQHTVPENLIWILSRNNVSFADCGPHRHLKTIGVLSVWNSLVLIQNKISKNFFIIFITKYLIHEKRLLPEKKKSYNPPRFDKWLRRWIVGEDNNVEMSVWTSGARGCGVFCTNCVDQPALWGKVLPQNFDLWQNYITSDHWNF